MPLYPCQSYTEDGFRCKIKICNGSYCFQHAKNPIERKFCKGITKKGLRCTKSVNGKKEYCSLHEPISPPKKEVTIEEEVDDEEEPQVKKEVVIEEESEDDEEKEELKPQTKKKPVKKKKKEEEIDEEKEDLQCTAITKKGTRCKKKVQLNDNMCCLHSTVKSSECDSWSYDGIMCGKKGVFRKNKCYKHMYVYILRSHDENEGFFINMNGFNLKYYCPYILPDGKQCYNTTLNGGYCDKHKYVCIHEEDGCRCVYRSGKLKSKCEKHRPPPIKCKEEYCYYEATDETNSDGYCIYHKFVCNATGCKRKVFVLGEKCYDCKQYKCDAYHNGVKCNKSTINQQKYCFCHQYKCIDKLCTNRINQNGFCHECTRKTNKCKTFGCNNTGQSVLSGYCFYCVMKNQQSQPCYPQPQVQIFKNSVLDTRLSYYTSVKRDGIITAMKNYEIDPPSITLVIVKKIYLKRALQYHPDKGGDQEKFKEVLRDKELMEEFLSK
jgi:hypothetical protein